MRKTNFLFCLLITLSISVSSQNLIDSTKYWTICDTSISEHATEGITHHVVCTSSIGGRMVSDTSYFSNERLVRKVKRDYLQNQFEYYFIDTLRIALKKDFSGNLIGFGVHNNLLNNGAYYFIDDYHISGKQEGTDSIADGLWQVYQGNEVRWQRHFRDGVLDGPFIRKHSNGNTLCTGTYKNGLLEGIMYVYFENGLINLLENYKNGKKEGVFLEYSLDGKLVLKSIYQNDLLVETIRYDK